MTVNCPLQHFFFGYRICEDSSYLYAYVLPIAFFVLSVCRSFLPRFRKIAARYWIQVVIIYPNMFGRDITQVSADKIIGKFNRLHFRLYLAITVIFQL